MKRLIVLLFIITGFSAIKAQQEMPFSGGNPKNEIFRTHDRFYLSMALGPVFGHIKDNISSSVIDMSGTGAVFDFKIGRAVRENLILHATIISNAISGPKIQITGNPGTKASDNLSVGETMIGAGLTYYIMPANILLSGSVGLGSFSIDDTNNPNNNVTTQQGFSMQLKIGREWWVSKRWALGVSFTYGKTRLTNEPGGVVEKLDSNRFGILFNASLN